MTIDADVFYDGAHGEVYLVAVAMNGKARSDGILARLWSPLPVGAGRASVTLYMSGTVAKSTSTDVELCIRPQTGSTDCTHSLSGISPRKEVGPAMNRVDSGPIRPVARIDAHLLRASATHSRSRSPPPRSSTKRANCARVLTASPRRSSTLPSR